MQIPALHLEIRLEDALLMTETAYEDLSEFVPIEMRDIEKMMVKQGLGAKIAPYKAIRNHVLRISF
jgi:hypothetical protein